MLRCVAAIFALSISISLFACRSAHPSEGDATRPSEGKPSSASWADDLRIAKQEASTEDERAALEDGHISGQEYAYFQNKIVNCLAGIGVNASWSTDKSLEYTKPPTVSNEQVNKCN